LYLLRRYDKHSSKKSLILLISFNFIWFFFHPYLGAMNAVFLAFSFGIKTIVDVVNKSFNWKKALTWLGIFAGPLELFLLINTIYDHHPNRSNNPIASFDFAAEPYIYFLPTTGPTKAYLFDPFEIYGLKEDRVGLLYLGLLTGLIVIGGLVAVVVNSIRGKKLESITPFQIILFGAGFLIMLLSYCWPFKLGLEWLADYIGPFRQFRTLERFG